MNRDFFYNTAAAAEYLGVSVSTLGRWRQEGRGPDFVKTATVNHIILYSRAVLKDFKTSQKVERLKLYDTAAAAEYLGMSKNRLKNWRWRNKGPDFVKPDSRTGKVLYSKTVLEDFKAALDAKNELFYDTKAAAEYLGVSVSTVQFWRCEGRGPDFVKSGSRNGKVLYSKTVLAAFKTARLTKNNDTLCTASLAAQKLSVSTNTLSWWRRQKVGPAFVKCPKSKRIFYRKEEIDRFL